MAVVLRSRASQRRRDIAKLIVLGLISGLGCAAALHLVGRG